MRINQLLLESHLTESKHILRESCDGLDLQQRKIVEGIVKEFKPLIEASLTVDQIQQLFGTIEKSATDAGSNRTALGKGVDVAKKANEVINNVGKWLQNTTPVQAFDAKFEKLKNDINKKFPDSKILDGISQMGIWAQENPGKTAAIIGILTALASLAGGPVGGAIAGQILRGSLELLKGEKLSTAIGKGLKTAAVGWLAGKSMEGIGKMVAGVMEYLNPMPITGFAQFYQENIGNGLPNIFRDASIMGNKAQLSQFNKMWGAAARQWQSGDFEGARSSFATAQDFGYKITNETLTAMGTADPGEPLRNLEQLFTGLTAAATGAASGATSMDKSGKPVQGKQESRYIQARPLSEGQVYMVFNRVVTLSEGPIWDKVKGAAGKAAGAVAQKAGQIGTNLTTKVTADKLNSAWKAAGSPMDSAEIEKILATAGVDPEVTKQVFTSLKIPAGSTASSGVDIEQVKKMIAALPADRKARLLKFLQKDITTAPAQG